jgi:OsmC-like protein
VPSHGGPLTVNSDHQDLGALQFEIKARQHTIVSDQPPENGGHDEGIHDEGMTPPELLLASLGSCVGFYAAQYLRKHQLATEGTRVRVTADKLKDPARIDNFYIENRNDHGVNPATSGRSRERSASLPNSQHASACTEHYVRDRTPFPTATLLLLH